MSEEVVFKGSRSGLKLILTNTVDFPTIENLIRQKLDSSFNFFQEGTVIQLEAGWLNKAQKQSVRGIFSSYGLILQDGYEEKAEPLKVSLESVDRTQAHESEDKDRKLKTTVINQTIRNGQEVISDGSIIINGNVNPGASIIAGGNIEVRGACRGIVHAGAFGDVNATVTAEYLIPMQIRVADLVARAPDKRMSKADAPYPEKAYVSKGKIVLEAINR
ncbi:septum site-determining protein MinC [Pectinatus haikarae]|uniref:Probable septum site-determining protein MinC n=1 Tax=Pectinatus haikarae TaxID=349096 RepID=A0ABT9Y5W9_9FIRM|nr:septum site-determining protein MinC [Pectinatus haikarae]MDQ0202951.1 septum site-determining protein MinC [Pectinatus haikarae]